MDTAGGPIDGTKNKKKKEGHPRDDSLDHNLEKDLRHGRGLSMDMGSPYLLPPGLQSSQESIHSLSLTVQSGDDRYRPATTFIPNDSSLMRSYPESIKKAVDDSSSYTGSSKRGYGHEGMNRDFASEDVQVRTTYATGLGDVWPQMPQIQAPEPSYGGLPQSSSV
jgi:hypothetical protein